MTSVRQHWFAPALMPAAVLLLFVLTALAPCFAQQTPAATTENPYNQRLATIEAAFGNSSPAKQAVLIGRGFRLRPFVDDATAVADWLKTVSQDSSLHPLVRDEALRYVAAVYLQRGDVAESQLDLDRLGVIRRWFLGTQQLEYGPRLWLDLAAAAGSDENVSLETSIYSERERSLVLRFGADGTASVLVNGARVLATKDDASFAFDQYSAAIRLKQGSNRIEVKLARHGGGAFRFAARLTKYEGGGIPVAVANGQQTIADAPDFAQAAVQDLVAMAKADSDKDSQSVDKKLTLAEIEIEHSVNGGRELLRDVAARSASAELWLEVASSCHDAPCKLSALSSALRIDPKNEPAMTALAEYYISRDQKEKARSLLTEAVKLEPADTAARARLTELFASAGLQSVAVRRTRELLQNGPVAISVRKSAAQQLYAAGFLDDSLRLSRSLLRDEFDDAELRALLARIYERRGDEASLQQLAKENAELQPKIGSGQSEGTLQAAEPARGADAQYLEDVSRLVEDARKNPPTNDAGVIVLADTRIDHLLANGLSVVHVQQVSYIATPQGAARSFSQTVQYSPRSERLEIKHARLHKANGSIVDASEMGEVHVADKSLSMYYDSVNRELEFPGIERGDVLELEYTIHPTLKQNPYGNYFGNLMVFRGTNPIQLKRYVLVAPASRKLNVVEVRIPNASQVSEADGMRVYKWETDDMAALPSETHGPSATEVAPYVHVSTLSSWDEMGRWYADMVQPQLQMDDELRTVAREIVAGKRTEFEKINAIYQYVLRNTRYVALEFGIYSYKPYPVTQTYQRRFGDCKDKASLMVALMRESGIEADLALLRTRRMGDIDTKAASIALFNHAIVYLPKWDLWLDGTADYSDSLDLPAADQGAMALVVAHDGSSEVRRVPLDRPENNYPRRTVPTVLTGNDGGQHHEQALNPLDAGTGKRK